MAKLFNKKLIKQAVLAAEANQRQANSQVKTRGQVSGGGKKPWKQKGTGRARSGSSRSPIWVGGGITFGPSADRHYKQELPKQMARAAIAQMFSFLDDKKAIVVVDKLGLTEPKTKLALKLLAANGAESKRTTIITAEIEPELIMGTHNLNNVTVIENKNVSILDLAHAKVVLIDKASAIARGLVKEELKVAKKTEAKKAVEKKPAAKKASK